MSAKIISGIELRNEIVEKLKKEIEILKQKNITPKLTIIQIGNVEASNTYVRNKIKLSEKVGSITDLVKLPEETTQEELLSLIRKLNNDNSVHGILLQLPIPKHIDENSVLEQIDPNKDVDCFHISNVGKVWTARKDNIVIKPCTPAGVIELIKRTGISMEGKNVVIVGRSNIVGKPLAALCLIENAIVTIAHSKAKDLKSLCKEADILIAAVGRAKMFNHEYVKENQIVIDVGINVDENGKLCGDVDFEDVKEIVGYITPVPGGVGPMTVTMLLANLVSICKNKN